MSENTLYERLGGQEALEAVVDDFYDRVVADGRVSHFFQPVDLQRQQAHMVAFLSTVAGGPAEYTGADMETAHDHLAIRQEHFDAIAELLTETLQAFDVPEAEQQAVLEAVASYEDAVVTERSPSSSSLAADDD